MIVAAGAAEAQPEEGLPVLTTIPSRESCREANGRFVCRRSAPGGTEAVTRKPVAASSPSWSPQTCFATNRPWGVSWLKARMT